MNVVALVTGGLDSTVLLYHLLDQGHRVDALHVDFGDEPDGRVAATCGRRHVHLEVVCIKGHAADKNSRRLTLLAVAAGRAAATGSDAVASARHNLTDLDGLLVFEMATGLLTDLRVTIFTPFLNMSKAEIVKVGAARNVPFAATWSCSKGGDLHCGVCPACVARKTAFQQAQVHDPTEYQN